MSRPSTRSKLGSMIASASLALLLAATSVPASAHASCFALTDGFAAERPTTNIAQVSVSMPAGVSTRPSLTLVATGLGLSWFVLGVLALRALRAPLRSPSSRDASLPPPTTLSLMPSTRGWTMDSR